MKYLLCASLFVLAALSEARSVGSSSESYGHNRHQLPLKDEPVMYRRQLVSDRSVSEENDEKLFRDETRPDNNKIGGGLLRDEPMRRFRLTTPEEFESHGAMRETMRHSERLSSRPYHFRREMVHGDSDDLFREDPTNERKFRADEEDLFGDQATHHEGMMKSHLLRDEPVVSDEEYEGLMGVSSSPSYTHGSMEYPDQKRSMKKLRHRLRLQPEDGEDSSKDIDFYTIEKKYHNTDPQAASNGQIKKAVHVGGQRKLVLIGGSSGEFQESEAQEDDGDDSNAIKKHSE